MTPLAPHLTAFLRVRLPRERTEAPLVGLLVVDQAHHRLIGADVRSTSHGGADGDRAGVRASVSGSSPLLGEMVDPTVLRRPAANQRRLVEIRTELNGPGADVGRRFIAMLSARFPLLKDRITGKSPLVSVEYRDRYVKSPLGARLVFEVLRTLKHEAKVLTDTTDVTILVGATGLSNKPYPYSIKHDWRDVQDQRAILEGIFKNVASLATVTTRDARQMPHDRKLILRWGQREVLSLSLDQGFGFLEPASAVSHRFDRTTAEQVRAVVSAKFDVRPQSSFASRIYGSIA